MALPENGGEQQSDSPVSEELSQIRENLQTFQQDLVAQLTDDVERLQAEKVNLLKTNRHLRDEQQDLQNQQYAVSRQQQQQWAKQLAQALANRLYVLLAQKLEANQLNQAGAALGAAPAAFDESDVSPSQPDISQLTRQQLISELSRYEGSMVERLNRMKQLEQRGEALLEALVERIERQQSSPMPSSSPIPNEPSQSTSLQHEEASPQASWTSRLKQQLTTTSGTTSSSRLPPLDSSSELPTPSTDSRPPAAQRATAATARRGDGLGQSLSQIGLIFILLSTTALSLHNVVVGIIGSPSSVFNVWETGGFIELRSLDSSLLILWLRMVIVMPLMAAIAGFIYPPTWRDMRAFISSRDRTVLRNVCGSGAFLFISQVLIYISIGQIGPGIAVTILFMYPIITVPIAWLLFGDRPTLLRVGVMLAISVGIILAALPNLTTSGSVSILGVTTAVLAGIAFAFYLISMQLSFRRLHPVPVSVIQFFTIFLLTNLILLFRPAQIEPFNPLGLVVGGLVLGTLTLVGYLLNNFGVRLMGAARASIVASSGPVLTALLAFLITPGPRTVLTGIQILGILVVTLGVTALAFERLLSQQAKRKQQAAAQQ